MCSGNTVKLTINNAPAGSSLQWLLNKKEINGANSVTFSADKTGAYSAVVTDNGVIDTLNTIQVRVGADLLLNGSGSTTINGQIGRAHV